MGQVGRQDVGPAGQADLGQRRPRGLAERRLVPGAFRQKRKLWPAWAWTASATLSSTGKSRKMLVIWNERASPRADRAWTGRRVTSAPAKRMRPASGCSSPASWATSVVLPAPLGPITAWISPGSHREAHAVGGDDAAEPLGQPFRLEERLSHGGGRGERPRRPRLAKSTMPTRIGPRKTGQYSV